MRVVRVQCRELAVFSTHINGYNCLNSLVGAWGKISKKWGVYVCLCYIYIYDPEQLWI